MKKILLFASAVLFSMMSFAGTQEILPSAYDGKGGESGIGGEATAVVGDITISSTLAYNKSNEHIREYTNSVITISSSKTITKIEITCTASGDAKYGPGKLTADGYAEYVSEDAVSFKIINAFFERISPVRNADSKSLLYLCLVEN